MTITIDNELCPTSQDYSDMLTGAAESLTFMTQCATEPDGGVPTTKEISKATGRANALLCLAREARPSEPSKAEPAQGDTLPEFAYACSFRELIGAAVALDLVNPIEKPMAALKDEALENIKSLRRMSYASLEVVSHALKQTGLDGEDFRDCGYGVAVDFFNEFLRDLDDFAAELRGVEE